jgi:hypothetical protein
MPLQQLGVPFKKMADKGRPDLVKLRVAVPAASAGFVPGLRQHETLSNPHVSCGIGLI